MIEAQEAHRTWPTPETRCSFCGKDRNEVAQLVAGPRGVYICNECVDLCRRIFDEEGIPITAEPSGEKVPGLTYNPDEMLNDPRFIAAMAERSITFQNLPNGGLHVHAAGNKEFFGWDAQEFLVHEMSRFVRDAKFEN